jgi:hypothetical protein
MFCPECGVEYREGFTLCSDCNVELVAILPEEFPQYIEYIEVASTFSQSEIAFLKSLLDSVGITYYFKSEIFTRVDPLIQSSRLMIAKDDIQKAIELLKEHNLKYFGLSSTELD